MVARLVAAATLIPFAFALQDSHPVVAWSSHKSDILDLLPSSVAHSKSVLDSIFSHEDICSQDAVVLVEQSGLHASDLRNLDSSSSLAKTLSSAPSSREFPYVFSNTADSFAHTAESLSTRCGSRYVSLGPGQEGGSLEGGVKHVVSITMPHLEGFASHRKEAMVELESYLANELESIKSLFSKHLVVFSGCPAPAHLSARQMPELDVHAFVAPNSTVLTEGGILKRYQLLTPALITTLVISFGVILPIILLGVSALASIQSPLSTDVPKGFDAQQKKTQ
ncbi:hypothetical protein HWV62_27413 [Athelia sp. TMB]|nr:hypothetical protein HWV62_27413 [Athelia sp. TMB]